MDVKQVVSLVAGEGHGQQSRFAQLVNEAVEAIWQEEGLDAALKPSKLTQVGVWAWLNRGGRRGVPAEYVRPIVWAARRAGVNIEKSELRPDVYGASCAKAA